MQTLPLFSFFEKYPQVLIALSSKQDGSMKLTGNTPQDKAARQNQKQFFKKIGITSSSVVRTQLTHGNGIGIVESKEYKPFKNTDGLTTSQKHLFLTITVADCLPIFLYDFHKNVIGIVHAGWKGLNKEIIKNAISVFKNSFNSNPQQICAGIGPGIGTCHFEVQKDVKNQFIPHKAAIDVRDNKYFVDLKKIAQLQLAQEGVLLSNIEVNPLCTFCEKHHYFSYRRDKSLPLQTMIALIGIRS